MTKPNKPYALGSWESGHEQGFEDGLRAGERRLARALRRIIKRLCSSTVLPIVNWEEILLDWLTARQKKERK